MEKIRHEVNLDSVFHVGDVWSPSHWSETLSDYNRSLMFNPVLLDIMAQTACDLPHHAGMQTGMSNSTQDLLNQAPTVPGRQTIHFSCQSNPVTPSRSSNVLKVSGFSFSSNSKMWKISIARTSITTWVLQSPACQAVLNTAPWPNPKSERD